MTVTIRVSRGLCSPMRDDVLTALQPFGVKILAFDCWGEGHYHLPVPPSQRMPDGDRWVRYHRATVTVSDKQAAWAERLLWQSNKVWLDSPPLNRGLVWTAPPACTVGEHGTLGRGDMPTPWSKQKHQPRQRPARKRTNARRRDGGGILDVVARWWR